MLTDDEIREGYKADTGRDMDEDNLKAFKAFMVNFACTDAVSYADALNKIIVTMADIEADPKGMDRLREVWI